MAGDRYPIDPGDQAARLEQRLRDIEQELHAAIFRNSVAWRRVGTRAVPPQCGQRMMLSVTRR